VKAIIIALKARCSLSPFLFEPRQRMGLHVGGGGVIIDDYPDLIVGT
jgi:hypothetical protein